MRVIRISAPDNFTTPIQHIKAPSLSSAAVATYSNARFFDTIDNVPQMWYNGGMKTCTRCHDELAKDFFYHGYFECKKCWGIRQKAARGAAKEKGLCYVCLHREPDESSGRICSACRGRGVIDQRKKANRVLKATIRTDFLEMYGGACACCGEGGQRFLTLDHAQNDGFWERQQFNSQQIIRHALNEYDPVRYQILCYNCNYGKRDNGGTCPHTNADTNEGDDDYGRHEIPRSGIQRSFCG